MRWLPRRAKYGEQLDVVEHLTELRQRMFLAGGAVLAAWVTAFIFHSRLIKALNDALPVGHQHPITFGVAEPFMTSMKVSFYAGLLVAMPVVLWQAWAFFAPASKRTTQQTVRWLAVAATFLALGGIAFGYLVALPAAVHFLLNYDGNLYSVQVRARDYYNFATAVVAAMAIVAELPLVIVGLVAIGALKSQTLRRTRRYGYAGCAVLAVALPGVDPFTTALEMIPVMLLYEASIWASVLVERRRRKRTVVTPDRHSVAA